MAHSRGWFQKCGAHSCYALRVCALTLIGRQLANEMHVKAGFTRIQDMSMTPFAPKAPSAEIGFGVRQLNARIIVTCELVQSATHCATRRLVEA